MHNKKLHCALEGVSDTFPLVLAAVPFAIVFGALGQAQGLPDWVVLAISVVVFAGASQFIAITMLATGAAFPIIIMTVFIVNLRHLLYAVSLIPYVKNISQPKRLLMGFLLTDETFAVAFNRVIKFPGKPFFGVYYLASAVFMYSSWVLFSWVGIVAGNTLPQLSSFGLDVAMVVAFVGIVVPQLTLPSHWCCAIVAGLGGIVCYEWPYQSGLLFASFLAILVGVLVERRQGGRHDHQHGESELVDVKEGAET